MGTFTDRLNNPDYKSWLKSGLILKHLKSGLEEYLEHESLSMHQSVLSSIQQGLLPGTPPTCTKCNNTVAKSTHWRCNICTDLRDKLDRKHVRGMGKLVLGNSDVSLWTNPAKSWEIAKCFMSAGYKNKCSAHETDCTGLLGLIINCKTIRDEFSPALIQPANVFEQVREIRNKVMHSPDLTSSAHDVNDLVQKSLDILEDTSTLLTKPAAIDAAIKIREIHTVQVSISREDEMQVLTDAVKALEVGQTEHEEKLKVMLEEHTTAIGDEMQIQCHDIESKTKSQIDDLKTTLEGKENKIKQIEGLLDSQQIHLKQVDTFLKSVNSVIGNNTIATRDIRANMEVVINNNKKLHELISGNRQWVEKEILDLKADQESIMNTQSELHSEQMNIKHDFSTVSVRVSDLESRQNKTQNQIAELQSKQSQKHDQQMDIIAADRNTLRENVLANTKARIETHAKNACYVGTSGVQAALDKLSKNRIVGITGKAGAGKTTAALEIMRRLCHAGTKPVIPAILDSPDQWDTIVNCNDKMVIFLDDPFGKSNIDDGNYERWENKFDTIWSCADTNNVYVIFGIRNHILKESRITNKNKKYMLFNDDNIIDLTTGDYKLSECERRSMLKTYMNYFNCSPDHIDVDEIVQTNPYYGFPQTCFLFFSDESLFYLGTRFFKHPDQALRNEIDNLRKSSDIKHKYQYCVLVYTLLYGNIRKNQVDINKMQNIWDHIQTGVIRPLDIKDTIDSLLGIYLTKTKSQHAFEFKHETILEAVILSFGELEPSIIIKTCSTRVLNELIKPECYESKPDEVVLRIPRSHYYTLVERLVNSEPSCCSDYSAQDERDALLRIVDKACSDPEYENTLSTLTDHPSLIYRFFIGCRFGKTQLVNELIKRHGQSTHGVFSKISKKFSKPKLETLSRHVIIHSLYQSIVNNHLSIVKAIVETDKTLVDCEYSGYGNKSFSSMFHAAALGNYVSISKYMFSFHPDIRGSCGFGRTMIHGCVHNDCYEVLKFLFETDHTLVDLTDETNDPLICYAGMMKKKSVVTLLCKYKANVKCYDCWGETMLHYCVVNDWNDLLETLVTDDPTLLNLKNKMGDSLICYASAQKKKASVIMLYKHKADIKSFDSVGKTLSEYCVDNDWSDVLELLISNNRDIANHTNKAGDPLICNASKQKKKSMVTYLSTRKADIKRFDSTGKTMLHYSVDNDWYDLLDRVLTKDYRHAVFTKDHRLVNLTNKNGDSLICYAALQNNKSSVTMLYRHKADIKSFDSAGKTLTEYCVDNDWLDILEILISNNRDIANQTNKAGDPLICYASKQKKKNIVTSLYEWKADIKRFDSTGKTMLHYSVDNDWDDLLDTVLSKDHILVDLTDKYGDSLIMYAAMSYKRTITVLMHRHQANILHRGVSGYTLLHYCVNNDWYDILEILIKDNPYVVNLTNNRGDPLIFHAVKLKKKNMIAFLYQHKTYVNIRNSNGQTMLQYCVANDLNDVVETLITDDPTLANQM